jgi:hypothetical protein
MLLWRSVGDLFWGLGLPSNGMNQVAKDIAMRRSSAVPGSAHAAVRPNVQQCVVCMRVVVSSDLIALWWTRNDSHACAHLQARTARVQYSPNGWRVLSAAHVFTPSPTVLSPYQLGAVNSNTCPSGSNRITDAVVCATAAASQGKPFSGSETVSSYPKGCYVWTSSSSGSGSVYFNMDASGRAEASSKLLCAVGAAPPQQHAHTHAQTLTRAHTRARCACQRTRAFARATRVCEWAHAH